MLKISSVFIMITEPKKYQTMSPTAQNEPNDFIWFNPSTQNEPNTFIWLEPSTQNEPHNFRHSFRALRMSPATSFGSFRAIILFKSNTNQTISDTYKLSSTTLLSNKYNSNNYYSHFKFSNTYGNSKF